MPSTPGRSSATRRRCNSSPRSAIAIGSDPTLSTPRAGGGRASPEVYAPLPQAAVRGGSRKTGFGHQLVGRDWEEVDHKCDRLVAREAGSLEMQPARSPGVLEGTRHLARRGHGFEG